MEESLQRAAGSTTGRGFLRPSWSGGLRLFALGGALCLLVVAAWVRLLRPDEAAEPLAFFALASEPPLVLGLQALEPQERLDLPAEGLFDASLRPGERGYGELVLQAHLRDEGGRRLPWAVPTERTSEGEIRIRALVRDLPPLRRGRWDVFYSWRTEGKTPPSERVAALITTGPRSGGSRVLFQQIEIQKLSGCASLRGWTTVTGRN